MVKTEIYFKMFNEIIKHAERDNCYECKQLIKILDLKERMEKWKRRDILINE